jgi:hypothetical protein
VPVQRRPVQRRVAGRVLRVQQGELGGVLRGGAREGGDEGGEDFCEGGRWGLVRVIARGFGEGHTDVAVCGCHVERAVAAVSVFRGEEEVAHGGVVAFAELVGEGGELLEVADTGIV